MKKILSVLLSLILCLGIFPPIALAEGGEVSSISELESAINQANAGETVSVKLTGDITGAYKAFTLSGGSLTLDLNGHKLSGGANSAEECMSGTIYVNGGALTVKGNGTIENTENYGLTMDGGELVVDGAIVIGSSRGIYLTGGALTVISGTIQATGTYGQGIYAAGSSTVTIGGGKIEGTGTGLYIKNDFSGIVELSGGTFSGGSSNGLIRIINGNSKFTNVGQLLKATQAEHYKYTSSDDTTLESTGTKVGSKDQPVTVKKCDNTATPNNNGNGTHSITCTKCNLNRESEAHFGEFVDAGKGKHQMTCMVCGEKTTHDTKLEATLNEKTVALKGSCGDETSPCKYQEDFGSVKFEFPEEIVYGDTSACVNLTGTVKDNIEILLYLNKNTGDSSMASSPGEIPISILPGKKSAGENTLNVQFAPKDVYASEYRSEPVGVIFNVEKAKVKPSIAVRGDGPVTKPYDESDLGPENLYIKLDGVVGKDDVSAAVTFKYNSQNVNDAKTVTATISGLDGKDAGNYELDMTNAKLSIDGTITKANQDSPPSPPTVIQDSITDTSISLEKVDKYDYSKDGTSWQESAVFTGLTPNTGYNFYSRWKGDDNHNPSEYSGYTMATTKKPMLNTATVTVSGNYTYNGAAQVPTVSVVKNGKPLVESADYNVTCTDNVNAGTATVTVTGIGAYEGENSATFEIGKKALTVSGATAVNRRYDGTDKVSISGVTLEGIANKDDVKVDTSGLEGTISGSNAGNYTSVTLPELTLTGGKAGNYTLTQPTGAVPTSVEIQKAVLTPKTGDLAVANKYAHTYEFGLGGLRPDVPAGQELGRGAVTYELNKVELTEGYYTDGAEIEGQSLKLPINEVNSEDVGNIGTVKVTIHTDNFEDMIATINVRSVNKTIPTGEPTLSANSITYGQSVGTITLSGSMKAGTVDVPGTFNWSSPENRPAVMERYEAAWIFTPDDNGKYAIANGTSAVRVNPASIAGAEVTLSGTVFRENGEAQTLDVTSVKLGGTTLTAGTDYAVDIPEGTEAGTYTVTVTGVGNYTGTATATFTVNPVTSTTLDNGMLLEVEDGLSSVPKDLQSNVNYDTLDKIKLKLRLKVDDVMHNTNTQVSILDVTLQYFKDGQWHTAGPDDFPEGGLTAVLPYPEGTGPSGYTFTVQHLICSGEKLGEIETLDYTVTSNGLQCKFTSLSPVAIGYKASSTSGGSSGGWYPSVSYYSIKIEESEHGTVTADPTSMYSGGTVTLTVEPDEGYKLDKITVSYGQDEAIELTEEDGKYTFKMPGGDVTVKAEFVPEEAEPWVNPFLDVSDTGWYIKAVEFVCTNGLMSGYSNGKFGPGDPITRAQLAQIIYNKEGRPQTGTGAFTDVTSGWYVNAVNWAAAEGIVTGIGGGKYAPNQPLTRQDLAVMLWRYAGSPEPRKNELDFADSANVRGYAWKALCWASENGIVNGKDNGMLDPIGTATRAETAQMLMKGLKID